MPFQTRFLLICTTAGEEAISVYPFLIALWLTFCLIVGTLYKGDLAAKLITPKIQFPFDDFEGLVTQKELSLYIISGSYLHNFGKVTLNSPNKQQILTSDNAFWKYISYLFNCGADDIKSTAFFSVHLECMLFQAAPKGSIFHRIVDKAEANSNFEHIKRNILARTHAFLAARTGLLYSAHMLLQDVWSYANNTI